MMRRCGAGLVSIVLLGCGGSGRALSPIRLESIVTLGATSGDGAIATTPLVSAHHPAGFRIVVPAVSGIVTLPLVFAGDGRFLGSLQGDGTPRGSFSGPMFTRFGPGDSIWVFDNGARVLVFDPARHYVRTVDLLGLAWDAVVLGDSRLVVTGDTATVARLFGAHGGLVRDIGATDSGQAPRQAVRALFPASDGTFWTTTIGDRWRLEHWDTTGARLEAIEPQAAWFPAAAANRAGSTDRPPPPEVVGAWLDAGGRLWVVGQVADRHWTAGLSARGTGPNGGFAIGDADKYYDTIVEVRERPGGRVIASAQFDIHCSSLAEPGVLVHDVRTSAGWQRAELLRVELDPAMSRP